MFMILPVKSSFHLLHLSSSPMLGTGSHSIAQDGFKLAILLPLLWKYQDYMHAHHISSFSMHVCIWIYIHTFIYTIKYMNIYTYMHTEVDLRLPACWVTVVPPAHIPSPQFYLWFWDRVIKLPMLAVNWLCIPKVACITCLPHQPFKHSFWNLELWWFSYHHPELKIKNF